ncbi:cingulin isoform X2 [Denticeps clupeoides]|nr:cingulin isoform X2 [Denticeps clupeoides]
MSVPSGRKTPVDYGVQIRFINDLRDSVGGPRRESSSKAAGGSRYGVAVRVQGIAGHPYVVLKEGEKGDSYGVQLKTHSYSSLPRRHEDAGSLSHPSVGEGGALRRAQSHGSLLERELDSGEEYISQYRRPPGDGRSGSYGNLDSGVGLHRNQWGGSHQTGLSSLSSNESFTDCPRNSTQNGSRQTTASSLAPNSYSSPPSSTQSSLGRGSVAKVTAVCTTASSSSAPTTEWQSSRRLISTERTSASPADPQVTPDLLLDQGQSSGSEVASEEDQMQQMIYSVLRHGSNESDAAIKHKANMLFNRIRGLKASKPDQTDSMKMVLEECRDECVQLQEHLGRKKNELHQTLTELTQLRMERENAESRVRDLEDQLASLQEELRRETEHNAHADTLHADFMAVRAELAELQLLKQKQEDLLRQRERELTALKGALKDEVATHDREIETLREQYSQDMERLRASMDHVSQSQAGIEAERQRVNSTVRSLQQQLEESREEGQHWRDQFQSSREELRSSKQELLQARLEKDEFEEELKDVQEKVKVLKLQIPDPKHTDLLNKELVSCHEGLKQSKSEVEKLKVELDKKVMEIVSLKRTNQEKEAEQTYELGRLRDQSRRDREELAKVHEKTKQLTEPAVVEALRGELSEACVEAERLRTRLAERDKELQMEMERLLSAQAEIRSLQQQQEEQEFAHTRLQDKVTRLDNQLQERVSQNSELEQELQGEVEKLKVQLEESRRGFSNLGQEKEEMSCRLAERDRERDALRKENNQLQEQKRQQERALDKLTKDLEQATADSRQAVDVLQTQLEEQREKSRREQQEQLRLSRERVSEQESTQAIQRSLQEELVRQKKDYMACSEERDNAMLDRELLTNRLRHLEGELETQRGTQTDKSREIRSMEDKMKRFEMELDEERNTVELLTDRITRARDQIEQLRSDLMQERSSKQDLELDKNALERQIKEYKSRVAEMEGQSRSSSGVSQLEGRVQELEERLHSEEREKSAALSAQRRLERRVKELNLTLDEEKQQFSEQRDQLTLRVKALKRQVDEGESEVERLEGLRRKALREVEEQLEQKDGLQARVSTLENELKRKSQQALRPVLDTSGLSSEDEDDDEGLYDPTSITSILTESNLQTSSC